VNSIITLENPHPTPAIAPEKENVEQFGQSVISIGDVNNDGIDDFAVGDPYDDAGGTDRGAIRVLLMNADGTILQEHKITVHDQV
jgi:hypothetical protein